MPHGTELRSRRLKSLSGLPRPDSSRPGGPRRCQEEIVPCPQRLASQQKRLSMQRQRFPAPVELLAVQQRCRQLVRFCRRCVCADMLLL